MFDFKVRRFECIVPQSTNQPSTLTNPIKRHSLIDLIIGLKLMHLVCFVLMGELVFLRFSGGIVYVCLDLPRNIVNPTLELVFSL